MKIKKIILLLILFFISTIFLKVNAATLSLETLNDVFYVKTKEGYYHSFNHHFFTIDGVVAYCTEPGVDIYTFDYDYSEDFGYSNMNEEQAKKASLIAYYGYDYNFENENHNTRNYRLATQKLIWETAADYHYEFYTQKDGNGDYIDISSEVEKINSLVNSHYTTPSFDKDTINIDINKEVSIVDKNGVLNKFEIVDDDGTNAKIKGNELIIKTKDFNEKTIKLKKKQYTNKKVLFYRNETNSQKLMTSGSVPDVYAQVNIKGIGGTVTLEKKDSKTKTIKSSSAEGLLKNAIYGIYDSNDKLIEKITTDDSGIAKSKNLNKLGKFYLKEITPSKGYLLDTKKYYFEITLDDLNHDITVYEDIIERKIEITKVLESGKTSILTPEKGVEFRIYNINGDEVFKGITDNDGRISTYLPYGKYILKQITVKEGYDKIQDYEFEIRESGDTIYKTFYDSKLSARLKIVKIDQFGNKINISNIKFKIKDLNTNEFVCQTISYPENKTICEYETNSNGELITPYPLPIGNYQLSEVDQYINGYLWNDKVINFNINDESDLYYDENIGQVLTIYFENKEVFGNIEIKKYGEIFKFDNNEYYYENIPLKDIEFGLYDEYNNLIKTSFTNKDGLLVFDNLKLGKYYIKELTYNNLYINDNKIYEINLEYIDQYTPIVYKSIDVYNYLKKDKIKIKKIGEKFTVKNNKYYYEEIPLKDIKFELYDEYNNLIKISSTDKDGIIIFDNLKLGKYYIKELTNNDLYIKDNKIYEIDTNKNNNITIKNYLKKGSIELIKRDNLTKELLSGAKFELYYYTDNIKDAILVCTKTTDKLGKIFVDNLMLGNYYFKEIVSPIGYSNNENIIKFKIEKDKEIIKKNIENSKIKIEVPKTLSTNNYSLYFIITLFIELGLIYVIKH